MFSLILHKNLHLKLIPQSKDVYIILLENDKNTVYFFAVRTGAQYIGKKRGHSQ